MVTRFLSRNNRISQFLIDIVLLPISPAEKSSQGPNDFPDTSRASRNSIADEKCDVNVVAAILASNLYNLVRLPVFSVHTQKLFIFPLNHAPRTPTSISSSGVTESNTTMKSITRLFRRKILITSPNRPPILSHLSLVSCPPIFNRIDAPFAAGTLIRCRWPSEHLQRNRCSTMTLTTTTRRWQLGGTFPERHSRSSDQHK